MAQPFPSLQGEGLGVGSVTSTLAADKDTNPAPFPSPTGAGGAAVYFFADFQTATVGTSWTRYALGSSKKSLQWLKPKNSGRIPTGLSTTDMSLSKKLPMSLKRKKFLHAVPDIDHVAVVVEVVYKPLSFLEDEIHLCRGIGVVPIDGICHGSRHTVSEAEPCDDELVERDNVWLPEHAPVVDIVKRGERLFLFAVYGKEQSVPGLRTVAPVKQFTRNDASIAQNLGLHYLEDAFHTLFDMFTFHLEPDFRVDGIGQHRHLLME